MGQEVGARVIRKIFTRRRASENEAGDEFDRVISKIERFAPKQYRTERDSHYYNYRMLDPYVGPVLMLLTEISNHSRLQEGGDHLRCLFEKLKGFYDPKDRLSLTEAFRDPGLRRKFVAMLSYFYGDNGTGQGDLKRFFGGMGPGPGQCDEGAD